MVDFRWLALCAMFIGLLVASMVLIGSGGLLVALLGVVYGEMLGRRIERELR